MKKLNNKGYMLVEIILAFAITFVLIYFLMDLVIKLKNKNDDLVIETTIKADQTIITNKLMDYIIEETNNSENITFDCNEIKVTNNTVTYKGNIIDVVDSSATIKYENDEKYCSNKNGKISIRIPIEVKQMPDKDYDIIINHRYNLMYCNPTMSYKCKNGQKGSEPFAFTYEDGDCQVEGNEDNWTIKFLTDGTFKSTCDMLVDVFLVGGGGGGGGGDGYGKAFGGGGGGGGGYTSTSIVKIDTRDEGYIIDIGTGGEGSLTENGQKGYPTKAFGALALGGDGGMRSIGHAGGNGGNGGSGGGGGGYYEYDGGAGSQNGGNGSDGEAARAGLGQTSTTCEFGESPCNKNKLYAGGGGGGGGNEYSSGALGGSGGGGRGQTPRGDNATAGKTNTGGGGGGGGKYGGTGMKGGSGIVIIRNARNITELPFEFSYEGENAYYLYIAESDTNWKIKFLTSGTFIPKENKKIDAFLVGGGGGGGFGGSSYGGGGGGGGKTTTKNNINLIINNPYPIIIGEGGFGGTNSSKGGDGGDTLAFEEKAEGGGGGTNGSSSTGGTGGSGGGGGGHYEEKNGGDGGYNGENGSKGGTNAGFGQNFPTYEFGNSSLTLYSGGGGGGTGSTDNAVLSGIGGKGGGGSGGNSCDGSNGMANTGGGGGGTAGNNSLIGGSGGSGIVVIRNSS